MTSSGISDGVPTEAMPRSGHPSAPVSTPLWERAGRDFAAWRGGDEPALARLVRDVTPRLWHLARAYSLDRSTAEDVVQATWLAMVKVGDAIRDEQAILPWLMMTARREAWRAGRVLRQEDSVEPELLLAAAEPLAPTVEDGVIVDSEARALWRQVARLPERCRRLLRAIAFEDRPDYRVLSADLQMPHGSIGPTRRRCLSKLSELLADDAEWGE